MEEKKRRQVTGESEGDLLAQLLNLKVRDRRWAKLQRQLRKFFLAVNRLMDKLPAIEPASDYPPDVQRLLEDINRFLATCAEYPQVSITGHVLRRDAEGLKVELPPRLVQEFAPLKPDAYRRNAVAAICALVRYGLVDRIRQCLRCEKWFFAVKSDSKYCSRSCQTQPTDQYRATKRKYAKRRYWEEKERADQAKIRVRGGRK